MKMAPEVDPRPGRVPEQGPKLGRRVAADLCRTLEKLFYVRIVRTGAQIRSSSGGGSVSKLWRSYFYVRIVMSGVSYIRRGITRGCSRWPHMGCGAQLARCVGSPSSSRKVRRFSYFPDLFLSCT